MTVYDNVVSIYTNENKYDEALQVLEQKQHFLNEKARDEYDRNLNKFLAKYYELKSSILISKEELDQAEEAITFGLDFNPSSEKLARNWMFIVWNLDHERQAVMKWFFLGIQNYFMLILNFRKSRRMGGVN